MKNLSDDELLLAYFTYKLLLGDCPLGMSGNIDSRFYEIARELGAKMDDVSPDEVVFSRSALTN
jgi:hypothetical protein